MRASQGEGATTTLDAPRADWWELWRTGVTTMLLVSDSQPWCSDVAAVLSTEGYAVRIDPWGASTVEDELPFDLVMADLGVAVRTATAVIAEIRSRTTLPILAVAPATAREVVFLDALAAGADQCVRQTAGHREIVARARSLLRRCPPRPREIDLRDATDGSISVHAETGTAIVRGEKVELTARECNVLLALLRQPGRVVTREALNRDSSAARNERDVEAVVRRLRSKLEAVEDRRRITTVRGVGFRFDV